LILQSNRFTLDRLTYISIGIILKSYFLIYRGVYFTAVLDYGRQNLIVFNTIKTITEAQIVISGNES